VTSTIIFSLYQSKHSVGKHWNFCWVSQVDFGQFNKELVRRKKSKVKKLSEMVLAFAGDYIAMGDDIEEKQQYLNSAVSAWNIACLDEKTRKRSIKKYMAEYRKLNPKQGQRDFRHVEEDLRLLIKQKQKLYPEVRVQIVGAYIKEIDGRNHVTVASLHMG
jgi:hypothetical protein